MLTFQFVYFFGLCYLLIFLNCNYSYGFLLVSNINYNNKFLRLKSSMMVIGTPKKTNYELNKRNPSNYQTNDQLNYSDKSLFSLISKGKLNDSKLYITSLPNHYNLPKFILKSCDSTQRYELTIGLLESINKQDLLTLSEYNIIPYIQNAIYNNNIDKALELVTYIESQGIVLTAKTYSIIIQGYGNIKSDERIDDVIKNILNKKIRIDLILLHNIMDAFIKCNKFYKTIKIFMILNPSSSSYINKWKNINLINDDSMNQLRSYIYSIKPNVRTFNIILKGIREMDITNSSIKYNYCNDILNNIYSLNMDPNSITINTIIDIAVITDNLIEAEKLLENPFAEPTVEAFTSMITGYANRDDFAGGLKILNMMLNRNIKPNSYTLTSLITACINANDLKSAQNIIKNNTYTNQLSIYDKSIIHGCYMSGLQSLAFNNNILEDSLKLQYDGYIYALSMDSHDYYYDITSFNSLLKSMIQLPKSISIKYSLLLYNAMKKDKMKPDKYTYSILFTILGKYGFAKEAFKLFLYIKSTNSYMDIVLINSLLKAFIDSHNPLNAISLYFNIFSDNSYNIIPNKITFTMLYLSLLRSITNDTNRNMKQNMITNNSHDLSMYSNILSKYQKLSSNYLPKSNIANVIKQLIDDKSVINITSDSNSNSNIELHSNDGLEYDIPKLKLNNNELLKLIYRYMRFKYSIEVDDRLVSTLVALFNSNNNLAKVRSNIPGNAIFNGFKNDDLFDEDVSRLIFEDLVISGWNPSELMPILKACKYPYRKEYELVNDDIAAINSIRSSAASIRIFQKHGWNSMDSSWSPI